MTTMQWTTLSSSGNSFNLPVNQGGSPEPPPKGLLATRAVEIKDGWIGQVLVDREIVWESDAITEADVGDNERPGDVAQDLANDAVLNRIKRLFTGPPDDPAANA